MTPEETAEFWRLRDEIEAVWAEQHDPYANYDDVEDIPGVGHVTHLISLPPKMCVLGVTLEQMREEHTRIVGH